MKKRLALAATATAVVGLGAGVTAASAADYLYWMSGSSSPSIGRASLDGSGVNASFISGLPVFSSGLAVDASKIYWMAGSSPKSLASANLDGSGVNNAVGAIGTSFAASGFGLAGSHVFVASPGSQANIARIGTDGSGLNTAFVSNVAEGAALGSIATDGTYIYAVSTAGTPRIARVNIDGTNLNSSFITGPGLGSAVKEVAVKGDYLYWTTATAIRRAKTDGTGAMSLVSGLTNADFGIAVTNDYIYWGWTSGGGPSSPTAIGRAKVDGTDANPNFITGLTGTPVAIAVTPGAGDANSTPTPTPAPTPAPTPVATTLATPTVNTSAPGSNAVVTVRTQLGPKGKYTFIFEKPSANEMSREQASSSRVPMQKGTRLGKRTLKKTYTAAVITTTADGAKVVTRALVRKAQAKKLNLRVVYAPTGTAQSESVIRIK